MEETLGAAAPGRGVGSGRDLLAEAVGYAENRRWEVCPGTWLVEGDGPVRCSCGDVRCAVPGAHPAAPGPQGRSSASPETVRRWWTETPSASVLLPTGRTFDVIDVPETAGCLALARMERMGLQLGPVVAMPASGGQGRRLLFMVLPGVVSKLPDLLRGLGWAPGRLDMAAHGDGGWIVAPPSRVGVHGYAQWARQPSEANRWLPEASQLIDPLAYACGREAPRALVS